MRALDHRVLLALVSGACAALIATGCDVDRTLLHPGSDAGSTGDASAIVDAGAPDASTSDLPPLGTGALAAGFEHTCAIRGGALYCWGRGDRGQLGAGDTVSSEAPLRVGGGSDWIVVATGRDHTCALDEAGVVWCFGANTAGQLGLGDTRDRTTPVAVTLPARARDVQSRSNHACAVLETGTLFCWGANAEGQLGLDDGFPAADRPDPVAVAGDRRWRAVGTGDGHTCAIEAGGALWCWGRNSSSHLGLGAGAPGQVRAPQQVGTDTDWASLSLGQEGSCALRADHTLWCWGHDLGTDLRHDVPTREGTRSSWGQVQLDTFHHCALELGGALYCVGRGIEGQLALGDNAPRTELTEVAPGTRFATVAVGRFYTCARQGDGIIACAGENDRGQLGVGDAVRRNVFTPTAAFP